MSPTNLLATNREAVLRAVETGGVSFADRLSNIDVFRLDVPRIFGAHPMAGVGDGAFWNEAGAVSAVKGHDRGCDISIVGSPQDLKIHGEALGQRLGAICNKLLALP